MPRCPLAIPRASACPRRAGEGTAIHRDYCPSGFFALRTPLLPFETLEAWSAGLSCATRPDDEALWRRDRETARERLRAWVANAMVREAVWLASPSLDERVGAWFAAPDDEAGVEAGLIKYLSRMAARPTPFGTFASNSTGRVAEATCLTLPSRSEAVRHTRLDMDFLSALAARLGEDPDVRARVPHSPNSSLHRTGDSLRYAEARVTNGMRGYFLVRVDANEAVTVALAAAEGGATLDTIATSLVGDGITHDDALAFVHQLVDAQVLVPDLGPVVTGPDALDDLIARLDRHAPAHPLRPALAEARDALAALDAPGLGATPETYARLAERLETLAPADRSRLFQVDVHRPAPQATLGESLVDELLRATDLLVGLFMKGRADSLDEFRRAFEERYGDREVPLAEALDEELGIGFGAAQGPGADPSPLLAGLEFPPAVEENRMSWGDRAQFLQWRVAEAIANGDAELRLEPQELERFRDAGIAGLPNAFHVMATLLAPGEAPSAPATSTAPHAVLEGAAGPSGARLLGRFAHGDVVLAEGIRAHLAAEAALRPHAIHAEVVHLPEGRVGNVLARPLLREHELEYLGASGAPRERVLTVTDLTVRLDAGRVVLHSRSLGREVLPRLTSAHFTGGRSLGIYRFLVALQTQGSTGGAAWSWGPFEMQPRLPRVVLGRVVLARQQWNASAAEAKRLRAHGGHAAFREVQRWRAERGLPRFVGLSYADNVLPVDLDQPLSIEAFLSEISGRDPFTVEELLPGERPDAVRSPEGTLTNEIVIPVVRRASALRDGRERPTGARHDRTAHEGTFAPGSEWLTVKLYCGPATADRVLVEAVQPVFARALGSRAATGGFFVRYADPDWHLRVRFTGEPQRLLAEVFPALRDAVAPFAAERAVHRVQLDPYVRETVRYGGTAGVRECEGLFLHDSLAAMAFVTEAQGESGLDARWRFALLGMDRFLADFGRTLEQRAAHMHDLAHAFAEEFRIDSPARKRMMARWRDERRGVEALLAGNVADDDPLAAGLALLERRSAAIAPHVRELRALDAAGALTVSLEDLLSSVLHMHANRVLRSSQRAHELVLHHWLENAYVSRLARAKARPEDAR